MFNFASRFDVKPVTNQHMLIEMLALHIGQMSANSLYFYTLDAVEYMGMDIISQNESNIYF